MNINFYRKSKSGTLSINLLLITIGILILTAPVLAQNARLSSTPPTTSILGQSIKIEALVEESSALPVDGRIYYRSTGRDAFAYVEMRKDRYRLTGEIPSSATTNDDIEYYIWVELDGGAIVTLPENAPEGNDPFRVQLRRLGGEAQVKSNAVVVLSPQPGEMVGEGRVLVAISLLQGVRKLDPANIRIFIGGVDMTSAAKASEEIVILSLPSVKPGEHKVEIYYATDGQMEKLAGWSMFGPVTGLPPKVESHVYGNVRAGYAYEDVSQIIRRVSFVDGRFNGDWNDLEWAARVYLTSLERGYLQPQHRFVGSVKYGVLKVTGGDAQPRFSEFSLWGVRTRGVEVNLKSKFFNLDFATGEVRRDSEGRLMGMDTIYVTDSNGDTLRSLINPAVDSIQVTPAYSFGTYNRKITAIRPGFPASETFTLSFNILKAKDDVNSITYGRAPKDNLVLGADIQWLPKNRRIMLTSETAISMYNSDISSGPMKDADQIKNLIVVNQFFDPLPTDSSILESGIAPAKLAGKVWSEIMESALAHRTDLMINYWKNEFKIGYKTIGRSFQSLGSPTVMNDVSGISIQDRVRLLNNRVYLTLGYESYSDNVNERAETTTDRNILRAAVAVYSPPQYPNVNLGIRTYGRKNDGAITTYNLPDGSSSVIDTRVKSDQNSFNFSVDQSFKYWGWDHLANVGFNSTITDDKINPTMDTDLSNITLGLTSRLMNLWELRASFSITGQESNKGANAIDYNGINLSARYMLLSNMVWLNAGVVNSSADGGHMNVNADPNDPVNVTTLKDYKVSFSRNEIYLGADYTPTLHHSFTLTLYKAAVTDDGYVEYYNVPRIWNKDVVKQDDTAIRLVYTYKL